MSGDALPGLDLRRLFATLDRHEVRYVVIGGIAAIAHGNPRATFDLDVTPRLDRSNLERLAVALEELNARLRGIEGLPHDRSPTDPDHLAHGGNWTLMTDAGPLDIMADPAGAAPYDDLERRAVNVQMGEHTLRIVGRGDLIAMKRAAGRPKDLDDIAALNLIDDDTAPPAPGGARPAASACPRGRERCGARMPLAKRACVLPAGHAGRHRSR